MESPVIGAMFQSLYEFSVCNSSINFYVGRSPTKNEYWHTFLSHGIQQFNHHGIVHCKIERFSDLWRSFITKNFSCKGMGYWSNSFWALPSFRLTHCFLTDGSVLASWGQPYCCTFVGYLHFTSNSFGTYFWVKFWAVVESLWVFFFMLYIQHVRSMGTNSVTSERMNFEVVVIHDDYWKFSIWYAMRTVSASQKAHMVYKRRR